MSDSQFKKIITNFNTSSQSYTLMKNVWVPNVNPGVSNEMFVGGLG